jgi:hypothetical protein
MEMVKDGEGEGEEEKRELRRSEELSGVAELVVDFSQTKQEAYREEGREAFIKRRLKRITGAEWECEKRGDCTGTVNQVG